MKLKQRPEDFIVEEINKIELCETGRFKLYILEKKSIDSFHALRNISRKNRIPITEIGFAGLKDRHAVTTQYITVPEKYDVNCNEPNIKVRYLGRTESKIRLGELQGNKFIITVRDITKPDIEGIKKKAEDVKKYGVPNYFDSQRFGSVSNHDFIMRHIIKKEYEEAVKIYLTEFEKSARRKEKDEKKKILSIWERFNNSNIKEIKDISYSRIIKEYVDTKDWLKAYKKIPANMREMFISSFQSYLWNQCVKRLLLKKASKRKLMLIQYKIGSLLFYKSIEDEEIKNIPETFPTISERIMESIDGEEDKTNKKENAPQSNQFSDLKKEVLKEVLDKEGLRIEEFAIKNEVGDFFVTRERNVFVKPEDLKISEFENDELNSHDKVKRYKVKLEFSLTKGSYATIVTKRIFNQ